MSVVESLSLSPKWYTESNNLSTGCRALAYAPTVCFASDSASQRSWRRSESTVQVKPLSSSYTETDLTDAQVHHNFCHALENRAIPEAIRKAACEEAWARIRYSRLCHTAACDVGHAQAIWMRACIAGEFIGGRDFKWSNIVDTRSVIWDSVDNAVKERAAVLGIRVTIH